MPATPDSTGEWVDDPLHQPMIGPSKEATSTAPITFFENELTAPTAPLYSYGATSTVSTGNAGAAPASPAAPVATPLVTTDGTVTAAEQSFVQAVAEQNVQLPAASTGRGFNLLNALWSGLTSVWSLPHNFGKIAILGAVGLATWALISHFSNPAKNTPMSIRAPKTALQAEALQQQLDQQLNNTSKALVAAGYDQRSVTANRNFIQLIDGTAVQASIVTSNTKPNSVPAATANSFPENSSFSSAKNFSGLNGAAVIVVGASAPSHYVPVSQVPAAKDVSTLNPSPTLSDIEQNSSVVHGVTAEQP